MCVCRLLEMFFDARWCRWKRQLIPGRKFTFADDGEKQQNASESVENFNPII